MEALATLYERSETSNKGLCEVFDAEVEEMEGPEGKGDGASKSGGRCHVGREPYAKLSQKTGVGV